VRSKEAQRAKALVRDASFSARRGSTADDGKMLVLKRMREHQDFPSVLPEFVRQGGARCLLLLCD